MYRAVVFDIGQTLVKYNNPLNWSGLYREALEYVADNCNYQLLDNQYDMAEIILSKYNTRLNPRDYEVSSDMIFREIMECFDKPNEDIDRVKRLFYSFFKQEAYPFPEVRETLIKLKEKGILLGTLSDVAYGMDNKYALEDISTIIEYFDFPLTSNDVGYRKPNTAGLKLLAKHMKIKISEIIYVGDEKKDIICANNEGAYAVLINRSDENKNYGQQKTICSIAQLIDLV